MFSLVSLIVTIDERSPFASKQSVSSNELCLLVAVSKPLKYLNYNTRKFSDYSRSLFHGLATLTFTVRLTRRPAFAIFEVFIDILIDYINKI